jgi:monoamine oxidase
MPSRRRFLRDAGLVGVSALLPGCSRNRDEDNATASVLERVGLRQPAIRGGFVGQRFDRGHLLRDLASRPKPDETHRTDVAIIGTGIAGLAAARALQRSGIDDYRLFELEDETGGNSRGGSVSGFACPLGAHYLPTPGPYADEVAELLTEYKLRRVIEGKAQYDEMTLCQSPQERLYIAGGWQDGLLPVRGQNPATLDAYRRFAALVRDAAKPRAFTIPTASSIWNASLAELDNQTFANWLDARSLTDPALCWYLDYCCRDDYGAGSTQVSAWAGLHYFASRHGFSAPGDADEADHDFEQDGVLTWPEGNAWLARKLAAPHRDRTQTGALVLRVEDIGGEVEIDVLDLAQRRIVRWITRHAIVATPLFITARLVVNAPDALREAATQQRHAPWLVANLHIDAPLIEHEGNAPLSWDNVIYGSTGLGYVNAMNQSTQPYAGPTVLSYYRAYGDDPVAGRKALLAQDWATQSESVLVDLSPAHPDLRSKVRQIEIMRYGHAMAIPSPGIRGSAWLAALQQPQGRLLFAHADLSAYSVFEEAFHQGLRAGAAVKAAIGTRSG